MKAFDSVDWDFLLEVMTAMEFTLQFISWTKTCITSAVYSVVIIGELEGFFKGEKGLRQGDPLSLYPFLLVMEGLCSIMQREIAQVQFTHHPKCNNLSISYLAFLDDLFLLAGADCLSIGIINGALDEFYHSSGLNQTFKRARSSSQELVIQLRLILSDCFPFQKVPFQSDT